MDLQSFRCYKYNVKFLNKNIFCKKNAKNGPYMSQLFTEGV